MSEKKIDDKSGRFRKISPKIWNDTKFNQLSDRGKLVFFFLLTHPNMTPLGAMRGTIAGCAEELGWPLKAFAKAFAEGSSKGMIKHNRKAHYMALPKFLRYNTPQSPNVVIAWAKCLPDIPECNEKTELLQSLKGYTEGFHEAFTKAFMKAFPETFAHPFGKKEKEKEKEKSIGGESPPDPPNPPKPPKKKAKKNPSTSAPDSFPLTDDQVSWAKEKGFDGDLETATETFLNHHRSKENIFVDWNAAWRNWILIAIEFRAEKGGKGGPDGGRPNPTTCRDCKKEGEFLQDGVCDVCHALQEKAAARVADGGHDGFWAEN